MELLCDQPDENSGTFYKCSCFGKVYFPRLTVPIATTISGLLALFFQLILLLCNVSILCIFGVPFTFK